MSLKLRAAAAVVIALGVATADAEGARPDFTGTWVLNAAASAGLRDDERKGVTLVVRQSDREIVFERTALGGPTQIITYALDGSERTSRSGTIEVSARSRWDGDKLLTEGTQQATVMLIRIRQTFKETRYVTDGGQTMIVESMSLRGNEKTDRRLVFTKKIRP